VDDEGQQAPVRRHGHGTEEMPPNRKADFSGGRIEERMA